MNDEPPHTEEPGKVAGSHEQFLKDISTWFSCPPHIDPNDTVDFLKLSGREWVRLLASGLNMSALEGWCARCKRGMWTYEPFCEDCGGLPIRFDDAFWNRTDAKIKQAIRTDHQLLAVVKAEWEDLYGAGRMPLFPRQLDWLGTLWVKTARPASRPFSPKRHYQLSNWLNGIPFSVRKVIELITTAEPIAQLRTRLFANYSPDFLEQVRIGFLSQFGAHGVDEGEWWRNLRWVTRQRLEPLARLKGERPRMK